MIQDTRQWGGKTAQPAPTPSSTKADSISINKKNEGNRSQKLKLFKRGNATLGLGAPNIKKTNQLQKPPNKTGI